MPRTGTNNGLFFYNAIIRPASAHVKHGYEVWDQPTDTWRRHGHPHATRGSVERGAMMRGAMVRGEGADGGMARRHRPYAGARADRAVYLCDQRMEDGRPLWP